MQMSLDMCNSVRRGAPSTFIVGDMPFGSYEISDSEAVKNAVLMIKDGKTDSIKLEGGKKEYLQGLNNFRSWNNSFWSHWPYTPKCKFFWRL